MRGAGCTYNDLIDRDLDAHVERTKNRPLPSGAVTAWQALVFLVLQALAGALVLVQFNRFTIILGLCSLIVVAAYPFAKRVTDWPQFVLGLAFSWGALVGWSATAGRLSAAPVLLYCGAVLWTIGYDTIYALQDKEDDALIGVRSTARLFGRRSRLFIAPLRRRVRAFDWLLFADAESSFATLGGGLIHVIFLIVTLDRTIPRIA